MNKATEKYARTSGYAPVGGVGSCCISTSHNRNAYVMGGGLPNAQKKWAPVGHHAATMGQSIML
jgi:hypothetical protein